MLTRPLFLFPTTSYFGQKDQDPPISEMIHYTIKGDPTDIFDKLANDCETNHTGYDFIEVASPQPLEELQRLFGKNNVKTGWKSITAPADLHNGTEKLATVPQKNKKVKK